MPHVVAAVMDTVVEDDANRARALRLVDRGSSWNWEES